MFIIIFFDPIFPSKLLDQFQLLIEQRPKREEKWLKARRKDKNGLSAV
jgi:hypothetical protein